VSVGSSRTGVTDEQYRTLLAFRTGLRRFLHWSEEQARTIGLSRTQHQLLLIVRSDPDPRGPTIGDVADHLLLRHHSAVGLVDRAEEAGLIRRERDPDDHRLVHLQLTGRGMLEIDRLSALHLDELSRLSPPLQCLWACLQPTSS
jgi:DNA-binding MarR family transcriptional regulator